MNQFDIREYIKNEGFNPFATDENAKEIGEQQQKDRSLIKDGNWVSKEKEYTGKSNEARPSAFNQMISSNWIDDDDDFFWGWRVRVEEGQAQGFITLLTVKEYHSVENWPRTTMGGPARGAVSDATAGLNCLFAMRRFCPIIEISHTYDKAILVGQTLETENTSFVNNDGIITETGVQRVVETGEQVGTYRAICKDLRKD